MVVVVDRWSWLTGNLLKMRVVLGKWLLFGDGHELRFYSEFQGFRSKVAR